MSGGHYEARLQHDLGAIRARLARISSMARSAVDEAVLGLVRFERDRMYRVALGDHAINRDTRSLDDACHKFVAVHLPTAGHLRFISAVLRLSVALERIGDYAVTICRVGVRLRRPLPATMADRIQRLADDAVDMLERATRAFLEGDSELARGTMPLARGVDAVHNALFHEVVDDLDRPLLERIGAITIIDQLERVGDQAKNVCELALFAATGETKGPKVYQVLFLDETGSLLAPLAVSLARRNHPESGVYSSMGIKAAPTWAPHLLEVTERLSLPAPPGAAPAPLRPIRTSPAEFHVVVAINLDWADLPVLPFTTVVSRWWLDPGESTDALAAATRALSARVTDLMEALRGDGAP